ncbi:MalY/PatB family protein [Halanaerobium salsuginis]|jgi:cystathionine beta-lyase|uniref:cysteine-S-conjugate beta-lyase n=1 Tax=Halanaerobium salsuginis TaxID=29563 RepID=A0A1I4N557_9FIRM|nr:MalY/PatB family protein [Halanaerobium salsuginis]SFM10525.1 cystathione beta-lyase [Halanaerobium salsuginis]
MKYDFSSLIDRRNTNSLKWDVKDNELPMWVADMDFQTAPEIIETVTAKAKKGVYGYTIVSDEWYNSISTWWKNRHNFKINQDWLIFSIGVVPAISSIIRKLTTVAENVVVQTPVYNIFFNSIVNNGRHILENKLVFDGVKYKIDFQDLAEKLADPETKMMILCNPHNPIGKIWDRETLAKIGELCYKNNVIVLSDEIHCDLTDPEYQYIPFASVSEHCRINSVSCLAPSKAFNMAGIHTAAVVVPNQALRNRVEWGLNTDEVAEPNLFAVEAAIAAFKSGADWLDQLRVYLAQNKEIVREYIAEELPDLYLLPAHATYLLWINCSSITTDTKELCDFIRFQTGLYLSAGEVYGGDGNEFVRLNIACPAARLKDGLQRLKKGIKLYKEQLNN